MHRILCNVALLLGLSIVAGAASHAAERSFELEIKELDREKPKQTRSAGRKEPKQGAPKKQTAAAPEASDRRKPGGNYSVYAVKRGDHIFHILMRYYGYSNDEAEQMIPEVARLNNLKDIRKLTIGQNLLIPVRARGGQIVGAKPTLPQAAANNGSDKNPHPAGPVTGLPGPSSPEVLYISGTTASAIVDELLDALHIAFDRNRAIGTSAGNGEVLHPVMCDRYFEYRGRRYIVDLKKTDPYAYTMLRLMEGNGYRVLRVDKGDDFVKITANLLQLLEITPNYGRHTLKGSAGMPKTREIVGFLPEGDGMAGRRLLIAPQPER